MPLIKGLFYRFSAAFGRDPEKGSISMIGVILVGMGITVASIYSFIARPTHDSRQAQVDVLRLEFKALLQTIQLMLRDSGTCAGALYTNTGFNSNVAYVRPDANPLARVTDPPANSLGGRLDPLTIYHPKYTGVEPWAAPAFNGGWAAGNPFVTADARYANVSGKDLRIVGNLRITDLRLELVFKDYNEAVYPTTNNATQRGNIYVTAQPIANPLAGIGRAAPVFTNDPYNLSRAPALEQTPIVLNLHLTHPAIPTYTPGSYRILGCSSINLTSYEGSAADYSAGVYQQRPSYRLPTCKPGYALDFVNNAPGCYRVVCPASDWAWCAYIPGSGVNCRAPGGSCP